MSPQVETHDDSLDAGGRVLVNRAALRHNWQILRRRCGDRVRVCPTVKADAYGHGLTCVVPTLLECGAEDWAVFSLREALKLREQTDRGRVVVLRPVPVAAPQALGPIASLAAQKRIALTLTDPRAARALAEAAAGRPQLDVHVKVDTGMYRAGVPVADARPLIRRVAHNPALRLAGVYTHLATADERDPTHMRRQLSRFAALIDAVRADGIDPGCLHAANSAAALGEAGELFDMVRIGIATYGCLPAAHYARWGLWPALRWVASIAAIKRLPAGCGCGYGLTFVAARDTRVGTVHAGYGHGYRRAFSNRAVMTVRGPDGTVQPLPVIGRVSMDQTLIDLTDAPGVGVGDEVTLIDDDPAAPNAADRLADLAGTIGYEVLTGISPRVPRGVVDEPPQIAECGVRSASESRCRTGADSSD